MLMNRDENDKPQFHFPQFPLQQQIHPQNALDKKNRILIVSR